MSISILEQVASIEADTSMKYTLIDARNRLLTIANEQLEAPEMKPISIGIRELLAHIYARQESQNRSISDSVNPFARRVSRRAS